LSKIYNQLKNWKEIAKRVKEIVSRIDPSAEIYVFGSVVRGEYTGASDIDILVITNNIEKKYEIMVKVYKEIDAPVELHIVTPEQYRRWYMRFVNEDELVKI
jgi:predicted nucleotidyltransferase